MQDRLPKALNKIVNLSRRIDLIRGENSSLMKAKKAIFHKKNRVCHKTTITSSSRRLTIQSIEYLVKKLSLSFQKAEKRASRIFLEGIRVQSALISQSRFRILDLYIDLGLAINAAFLARKRMRIKNPQCREVPLLVNLAANRTLSQKLAKRWKETKKIRLLIAKARNRNLVKNND